MPLTLDPSKTALVLIDLQHGIVSRGPQPHSAEAVLGAARSLAGAMRAHGALVVYVRVDFANLLHLTTDTPMGDPNAPPPPAIASEIVPEAGIEPGDLLITKRHWSAFGQTELASTLKQRGIDTIILGGIATNMGVESTAREATSLGFHVVLAEDACSTFSAEMHQFALQAIFPRLARVRSTQDILDALA